MNDHPDNPTLGWARYYAALNWSVIPAHRVTDGVCTCDLGARCVSPGKHPAVRWTQYQKVAATAAQIERWFTGPFRDYGVGVITGSCSNDMFVVDVDQAPGKPGPETFHDLQMQHDEIPETVQAITGGGGRHYLFKAPPGVVIKTDRNIMGPGVDTRGEGGFIVVAPSIHQSGQYYLWDEAHHPSRMEVADAPQWILDQVAVNGVGGATRNNSGQQGEIGISAFGQVTDGREKYMVRIIGGVIGSLIREHGALPEADEVFEQAWPTYEIKTKARGDSLEADGRGESLMRQRIKHLLKRAETGAFPVFQTIADEMANAAIKEGLDGADTSEDPTRQDDTSAKPKDASRPFPASSFVGDPPPREWIIPDWLPLREVTSLYGDGGVGKTLLAQQLATCIATGRPFYEHETIPMPVLAVLCEDAKDELHRRHNAINTWIQPVGRPEGLDRLWMWPRAHEENVIVSYDKDNKPLLTDFYKRLLAEVAALPEGNKLVILDTLADIFAGSEISRAHVNHFVKSVVGRLVKDYGATVLMLGHPSVAGQATGSGMSGSSAWNAAVRSRWYLERLGSDEDPMGDRRVLVRKKSNYAKAGPGERLDMVWQEGVLARFVDTSGDAVDRLKEANDAALVWQAIASAWGRNQPYSDSPQASNFVGNVEVIGCDGKRLQKAALVRITQRMIEREFVRVEPRTNVHRGGLNGYRWVKHEY